MFQPPPPPPQQQQQGPISMFSSSAQSGCFLPPTPPRAGYSSGQLQSAQSLGRMGSFTTFNEDASSNSTLGYQDQSGFSGGSSTVIASYMQGSAVHASPPALSPSQLAPQYTAAELLYGSNQQQQQLGRCAGTASTTAHAVPGMLQQQYHQQQHVAPHDASMMAAVAAAAGGLQSTYQNPPLPRAATMSEQQIYHQQQQQQQQLARSLSFDVNAGGYGMYGGGPAAATWTNRVNDLALPDQGRLFGAVYDMKSLTAALSHVQAGTGEVRRMLASCTFRPRLPGLTKLVSQLSREGNWAKALEVYESLDAVGVRPDTTITNAAISACDKGAQWEKALQVFRSMSDMGLERDAITYSALISALSKGRQWCLAIDVFNHMVAEGVECDAVTCCSLITALDKGGQWQLAEQVFIQMFQGHTQFHVLLEGMQQDTNNTASTTTNDSSSSGRDKVLGSSPSSLLAGTFSVAALNALSIPEDGLPPPDQLVRLSGPPGLASPEGGTSGDTGGTSGDTGTAASGTHYDAKGVAYPQGTTAANEQQQQQQGSSCAMNTSPNSVLSQSLSAQLAEVGLLPTSNSAAIKGEDEPSAAAAAAGASPFAAFKTAGPTPTTAASPSRPPVHPPTRAAVPLATFSSTSSAAAAADGAGSSGSTTASPLLRQPSAILLNSPSGNIGLRFGRAGSLNSKKSSPNRVCCNALLAAYARAVPPRWKQALKLLEVMWQCGGELVPDIVSYNTVMKACGNAQQTDIAFQLYHHMQQRGIDPTVATYGTLITIASESQDYSKVKESWGWLQASGLPVHITCVNSYLTALIKEDNWDAAVELFNMLKGNHLGVRANNVTYNILMSACLARDKPQTVKALFEEMTASNLSPTLISFNTLLHAYAKLGAWQESLALISHLCSSAVRPSAASFNTVFCTLGNVAATVGEFDKHTICSRTLELYALMLGQPGIHVDATLYRNMVSTFTACNAPQLVLQVALTMIQQGHNMDPATAATALEALQQEGAWQAAGPLLRSCCAAGSVVSHVVVQRVLLACAGGGFWHAAREVLQVTAASNQLDNIAQVLQQYRSQYTAAGNSGQLGSSLSGSSALINPESLDELLFLTFLQAQYNTGGWAQGLDLFKQLRSDRGIVFAAGNAAVYGALLELLVVRGGAEGMVAAIQVVDECHATGTMSHYLPHLSSNSSSISASAACGSPQTSMQSAVCSGILSPEQQLILQLERAAIASSNGPQSAACSLLAPGSFGMGMAGGSNPASPAAFSGMTVDMLTGLATGSTGALPSPLSFLDVRGCSAIETVVLVLSFLGQVVQARVSGVACNSEYLMILTGGVGAASQGEMSQVLLHRPVAAVAASSAGSVYTTAAKEQSKGAFAADVHEITSCGDSGVSKASADSSNTTPAAAPVTSSNNDTVPTSADAIVGVPHASSPSAITALSAPAASPRQTADSSADGDAAAASWEVPCSNITPHIAALAILNGRLSHILGCKSGMELLVPFSAANKLALGLLCCSALPMILPDESQGGGICLPVADLMQAVSSALDASRA